MLERYVLLKLASDCASGAALDKVGEKAKSAFPTMDGVSEFLLVRHT